MRLKLLLRIVSVELEEAKQGLRMLLTAVSTNAPLTDPIHMVTIVVHPGAAPHGALVFAPVHPVSAASVGHVLEGEGEDTLLANSWARHSGTS